MGAKITAIDLKLSDGSSFVTGGYFRDKKDIEELKIQLAEPITIDGDSQSIYDTLHGLFNDDLWNIPPQYVIAYYPDGWTRGEPLLRFCEDWRVIFAGTVINTSDVDLTAGGLYLNNTLVGYLSLEGAGQGGSKRRCYGTSLYSSGRNYYQGPLFPSCFPQNIGGTQLANFRSGTANSKIYIFDSSILNGDILDLSQCELAYNLYKIPCLIISISAKYTDGGKITGATIELDSSEYYQISSDAYSVYNGLSLKILGTDPYEPGGTSGGGGGGGSFDRTTGNIDHPGLPSIQLTDTGFINLFNPSPSQLKQLSDYMWSDTPNWDDFKKVLANPMDAIIGLLAVPVNVPPGQLKEIYIGNISTGVFMTSAASQWITHSCGSIVIPEYYGSYLDYSPYTSFQIYLPYIGMQQISANDVISHAGKTLSLKYNVDILSGACIATLKCGSDVLYDWQGSCGLQIPFTSLTYGNFLNGMLQVAGGALSALASPISGLSSMISGAVSMYHNDISHGGSIAGSGGFLNIQTPYFIITRPNMCTPGSQNSYIGYPSYITVELANLSGYTEIDSIHLENIPATASEVEEIENILKSGVIF